MTITLNGMVHELADHMTVADAVAVLAPGPALEGRGIAVALNGDVVPRSAWHSTPLTQGAKVEVLTAVQGG